MKENNMLTIGIILLIVVGAGVFIFSSMRSDGESDETTMGNDSVAIETPKIEKDTKNTMNQDTMKKETENQMDKSNTIVDIAVSDPRFSTLVNAVKEAGLVETLSGKGPFTVFAPTNEAFSKIPEATLNDILADKEQLTAILTYHVLEGEVFAEDVVGITSAKTVQGGEVNVEVTGNSVMIDNAKVTQTDIEAENGVIHVIDTVLIPQ